MDTFRKILVAIDATQPHSRELEVATRVAEKAGGALLVVDVVPHLGWAQRMVIPAAAHVQDLILRERTQQLRKIAQGIRQRGLEVKSKVLVGRTAEEIIRQVIRGKHDLVVCAAKSSSSPRPQAFGGTAFELLRNCPSAVWLCTSDVAFPPRRVLAAVDPSPELAAARELDLRILEAGRRAALLGDGQLEVVKVWSVHGERVARDYMQTHDFGALEQALEAEARKALDELTAAAPAPPCREQVHLARGSASLEIARLVHERQVDLLVMGTVGRSGLAGLLMGNTAEVLLHQVRCSVLALKPEGFVSHVRLRARRKPSAAEAPSVLPLPPMPPVP